MSSFRGEHYRGIDFIPNLSPVLRRAEIDSRIAVLQDLKIAEMVSRTKYLAAIDWLEEHRFYLREGDCVVLNPLVEELEERLMRESKSTIRIVRGEFKPHPAMDEAMYYAQE